MMKRNFNYLLLPLGRRRRVWRVEYLLQLLQCEANSLDAEEVPHDCLKCVPENKDEYVLPPDRSVRDGRAEKVDERRAGDDEDLHRHAFRACRRL